SEQVVCGYMFTGTTAQVVTLLHVMLFLWIAWGSFLRQRFVAFVTAGYLLYLVASLWIWTLLFGAPRYPNAAAVLLLNLVSTLVLLTLCRVVFRPRAAFPR